MLERGSGRLGERGVSQYSRVEGREHAPSWSLTEATTTETFASSCWALPLTSNVASAMISNDVPRAKSGASPERTLSSQASHAGSEGEEKTALMAATEH